ncbi:MAG: type II toxin-antitoxin system HicB family antitoxin [Brevundimonas sp.]|uniref:type II toxin-antitoxin system HicB family antitoxin n=1 Tax=Brevundimonas sp. TaxID=1871086 RepID=UPI0026351A62|nr:type II toxin-antitoxin system HicB family antitoxin [Brevundimonas sp.]MDI6624082.1 type II toxin-antitoxin system HicB family antitoxin [Brevundimonas sp.]MDQ7812099.1 type II toxin-antitoxin system HicB family antitoxin [Brevundimonas sp.]
MSTVIYVAIVEGDQDRGYSAFFPDLPGCVTAAETMVELPSAARDALSLHLQGMAEDGDAFPEPTALEAIKADAEVKEVGRILVDTEVEDAPVRVNISIGAQFLKRVDVAAEARGMSRSGFLVEAARAALESRNSALTIAERWDQLTHAVGAAGGAVPGQYADEYLAFLRYAGVANPDNYSPGKVAGPVLETLEFAPGIDRLVSSTALERGLHAAGGQTVKVPRTFKAKLLSNKGR